MNATEQQIKDAQHQLKSAGLYKGSADGQMGPATKEAIQKFQQQHGLQATGALDEQTLAALQSNTGGVGSSPVPTGQSSSSGSNNRNSNSTSR